MTRLSKTQEAQQGVAFFEYANPQRVAVAATSAQSTTVGDETDFIKLIPNTDCHILIGENPTAAADGTSHFIPASQNTAPIPVKAGLDKVAVIQDSAAGFLYITELV